MLNQKYNKDSIFNSSKNLKNSIYSSAKNSKNSSKQKNSKKQKKICTIHFDGSCQPNPGKMQIGVVLKDHRDKSKHIEVSKSIGEGTNNVSELTAALVGLYLAKLHGYTHVTLIGDSNLSINVISGKWKLHKEHLKPILEKINKIKSNFVLTTKWVPREKNVIADMLSVK